MVLYSDDVYTRGFGASFTATGTCFAPSLDLTGRAPVRGCELNDKDLDGPERVRLRSEGVDPVARSAGSRERDAIVARFGSGGGSLGGTGGGDSPVGLASGLSIMLN